MKNNNYWVERFTQEEELRYKDARAYLNTIERQYDKTLRNIQQDITYWYDRIAKNNNVSLKESKELLSKKELEEFKWTLEEYIQKGQENAISKQWIKQLENASARVHISKLESLKFQIQNEIEGLYGERLESMNDYLTRVYGDTYYKSAFITQIGTGIGKSLNMLDTDRINTIIHKPWAADGKNFSERIWEDKTKLINSLHNGISQAFIRGSSLDEIIKNISKEFGVKKSVAGRLVMTETAAYSSQAKQKCFNDLDVEKYEIIATLDTSTSEICREMDGKVFSMKDYQIGVTASPFHPNCRTTEAPYFEDDTSSMRAMRGQDGKVDYVPANMKYQEWYDKYIAKDTEKNGIIKVENKKIKATMELEDYNFYMELINNSNEGIKDLYQKYSNDISSIKRSAGGGAYTSASNTIDYSYPREKDIKSGVSKYSTLAHEYGHYFDKKEFFNNLNYKEIEKLNSHFDLGSVKLFKDLPSSSDEFLEALAKDKNNFIKTKLTKEIKEDLLSSSASGGVQDALDGMFGTFDTHILPWGHGDSYYNRLYNKKIKFLGLTKELKDVYESLGFTAKNQTQVKNLCRRYETASEAWANICSAVTCGGKELEYTKKYLPNMYKTFLEIIKNVK